MALPPFSQVIKSRDVEDPVNMWLHRPLAYAFVALTYRTPLTPNEITFTAMLIGMAAGGCWLVGTPALMILGGILLWASGILDGADGILARSKHIQSEVGRAIDGVADMVVALSTVFPAFVHIWRTTHDPLLLALMPVALGTAIMHVYVYDFYKECYLGSQNSNWHGTARKLGGVRAKNAAAKARGVSWAGRFSMGGYLGMLINQQRFIALTNREALRLGLQGQPTEESKRLYRRYNYVPMQLWTWISLCPHTYVMAICAMAGRLDIYLWLRVVGANGIFIVALIWQRIATARTVRALDQMDSEVVAVSP